MHSIEILLGTARTGGQSSLVLQPSSSEQIVDIVKLCLEKRIALCVQGGNTGLVKGSIPIYDEVILSMAKMNRIIQFEPYVGLLTCEAGCILQTLETFINKYDYTMPIDLGSKGSCQIGGNISTAAGGVRFVRYGSLHSSLIGLEAIIPGSCILEHPKILPVLRAEIRKTDYCKSHAKYGKAHFGAAVLAISSLALGHFGTGRLGASYFSAGHFSACFSAKLSLETSILSCMNNVLKDNMGLHMPHLFLGAEGQLGVLTKIRLRCSPMPESVNIALLELNSFDKCLRVLSLSKKYLGEILSAFELIDKPAVECIRENLKDGGILTNEISVAMALAFDIPLAEQN
uniref:FAD-binding PCMH-type domain-containing protein n=1 Tax=Romanomermis culicivorax TaxID=13658 RepID=A0A915JH88_ROMCU